MPRDEVVSLFSGAGGMSLGFAKAGAKPVFAADIDRNACKTYRDNLGVEPIQIDITKNDPSFENALKQYHDAFALIGGPPCQGFSSAGRKDGEDKRNRLIFNYLRIVATVAPRWFLFENVEGLLTSNRGNSLYELIKEFIKIGYRIRLEKINFAAYGLPQGRKRVILIGNRIGIDFAFPTVTHSFNAGKHKYITSLPLAPPLNFALAGLGPVVNNRSNMSPYLTESPLTLYDRLMREENPTGSVSLHVASVPPQLVDVLVSLRPGQTMKDLPSEYWHDSFKRRAFRRVLDGIPTEKRGGAPSGIKRLVGELNALTITSAAAREFIHPTENRPLTLRECARLQSFPDRYVFAGSLTSISRQIGNAFPPLAAQAFARHLMELDGAAGADIRRMTNRQPGLIDYHLTDATGMSPALARTGVLLSTLATQRLGPLFDGAASGMG